MLGRLRDRWAGALALAAVVAVAVVGVGGWLLWSGEDDGSPEELCALLADRERFSAVVENFEPADVGRSLDQLRVAREQLTELRAAAPAEVRDDLDVQISATESLTQALESAEPGDTTAAIEAVRAAQADLGEVRPAYDRLERWAAGNCT